MITINYNKEKGWRQQFVLHLLHWGTVAHMHGYIFRKAWGITVENLKTFPEGSLGHQLHQFYCREGFAPISKSEHHDVFHVLLEYNTGVKDETGMQFFLMGNGKRSPFTASCCFVSFLLFPEYRKYYLHEYRSGKSKPAFVHLHFKCKLGTQLQELRNEFKLKQHKP